MKKEEIKQEIFQVIYALDGIDLQKLFYLIKIMIKVLIYGQWAVFYMKCFTAHQDTPVRNTLTLKIGFHFKEIHVIHSRQRVQMLNH